MATEHQRLNELFEALKTLPPDKFAEVLDFVEFLKQHNEDRCLVEASMRGSEGALTRIWDNDEDAVYDNL